MNESFFRADMTHHEQGLESHRLPMIGTTTSTKVFVACYYRLLAMQHTILVCGSQTCPSSE